MSRRQWKAAITTTTSLTPTTRLGLLEIADVWMTPGGQVQTGIWKLVGEGEARRRRIQRYVQQAYEHCWLQQTSPGYRGHAATYIAVVPEPNERQQRRSHGRERVTSSVTHKAPERVTPSSTHSTPEKGDTLLSPQEEVQGEHRERVAVKDDAPGENTTTAGATNPADRRTATAPGRENPRNGLAVVAGSPHAHEDEITRAARVLDAFGMLHHDRTQRVISDVQRLAS